MPDDTSLGRCSTAWLIADTGRLLAERRAERAEARVAELEAVLEKVLRRRQRRPVRSAG
jgi:hypothetical protein